VAVGAPVTKELAMRSSVRRVEAAATLTDPRSALTAARGRATEDPDWALWVDEYARGEALIVDLVLTARLATDDGRERLVKTAGADVWLQTGSIPEVEAQIEELATVHLAQLELQMSRAGLRDAVGDLCHCYIHVRLADDVSACLARTCAAG
jgi:hypothetical protein